MRPLAPLHGESFERNYGNQSLVPKRTKKMTCFILRKGRWEIESSIGTGSASRRAFSAVEVENFEPSYSSSSSSSLSNWGSDLGSSR
nr:formin-like protein 1 isoform X3 [Ipomoea trifida]